jgi:hypothetical protein
MEKLDPMQIDSIEIVKEKETVLKYTDENYDGVIIIHLKKE